MVVNITRDSIGATVVAHSAGEQLTCPITFEGDTAQNHDFFRPETGIA